MESEKQKARREAEIADWAAARQGARIGALLGSLAGVVFANEFWLFQGLDWPLPFALMPTAVAFLMIVLVQAGFWALVFVTVSVLGRVWRSYR